MLFWLHRLCRVRREDVHKLWLCKEGSGHRLHYPDIHIERLLNWKLSFRIASTLNEIWNGYLLHTGLEHYLYITMISNWYWWWRCHCHMNNVTYSQWPCLVWAHLLMLQPHSTLLPSCSVETPAVSCHPEAHVHVTWLALAVHTGGSIAVSAQPLSPAGSPLAINITKNNLIVPNNIKICCFMI